MSNRSALPILLLTASCSGQLSMGGLLGNSSSSSASQASSPASAAADTASSSPASSAKRGGAKVAASDGGLDYDFTSPPVSKTDRNLLTMPKFFQAGRIAWAWTRSPWTGFWLADVLGDQLGEHARLRLVASCVSSKNDLQYAACITDAHRLDRNKLIAEIEASPETKSYRAEALKNFDEVTKRVAARDAEVAKRAQNDPAFKQMFETIPAAVAKQWDGLAATQGPLLAIARSLELQSQKRHAMDDSPGPSRKAFAGCTEKLAPAFAKAIHATEQPSPNATTFGIATTPLGYIATLAMYYCARGNDSKVAGALGEELEKSQWLRGPRMATIETLLAKAKTIQFDDKSYSIDNLVWRDANYVNEDEQLYGENGGGHGIVKQIARNGATLHVVFAKGEIEYPTCDRSERTGAWHYDNASGNFEPVEVCTKWGSAKEKVDIEPIDIDASQGAAIQPGRYVEWQAKNHEDRDHVAITAVWDGAKQKKLVALFGVAR